MKSEMISSAFLFNKRKAKMAGKIPRKNFQPESMSHKPYLDKKPKMMLDPMEKSKKVSNPTVPGTPKLGDIPNSKRIPVNKDSDYTRYAPKPLKDNEGEHTRSTEKKAKYNPLRKTKKTGIVLKIK